MAKYGLWPGETVLVDLTPGEGDDDQGRVVRPEAGPVVASATLNHPRASGSSRDRRTAAPEEDPDRATATGDVAEATPRAEADGAAHGFVRASDQHVANLPLCDQPIFRALLGPAGTGKSTLIRSWVADADEGEVCLTTTTGVAAINLGDATTIHSLLHFFDLASLEERFFSSRLQARLRQLLQAGTQHLVTDEISMFSADHLTLIVRAIEEVNGSAAVLRGDLPPLHWTVVGDFCQLPPVGEKGPGGRRRRGAPPPKLAFESPEWGKFEAGGVTRLTKVWRQEAGEYLEGLQGLRKGDAGPMEDLCALDWQAKTDLGWEGTTLFATNEQVDRYNALRHDAIDAEALAFPTTIQGQPRGEWKTLPPVLQLKPGALVMVLANRFDRGDLLYANGDLGTLKEADDLGAWVELQRGGDYRIGWVERTNEKPLDTPRYVCTGCGHVQTDGRRHRCEECRGHAVRRETAEEIGRVRYMPLRLAYASTVHKAQGLTLDRVQINLRDPFWRTAGIVYVGFSRCRSYQGLRLVGEAGSLRKLARMDERVRPYA